MEYNEQDLERFPMDSCPRNRRSGEPEYPFAGRSIWLTPSTPSGLMSAGMDLRAMEHDEALGARGFAKLARGLSQTVARHDLPGMPQLWGNPDAVEDMPTEVVFHIYQIVISGELPDARPNASTAGLNGASTQPFTVTTTSG